MNDQPHTLRSLAAVLILSSFFSGCVGFSQTERRKEDGHILIIHQTPPDSLPRPASLAGQGERSAVRLTLGGDDYELPFSAGELTDHGWTMDERFDREAADPGVFIPGVVYTRSGQTLRTVSGNPWRSGRIPLADGFVFGVEVMPRGAEALPDFSLEPGVAPGMTAEELTARLGPAQSSDADGLWQRQIFRTNGQTLEVYLDAQEKVAGFYLLNPMLPPGISSQAAAEEFIVRPPFWGEDPTTGRLLIEGEFFRVPGTVRQFFASGWSVARGLPTLLPGTESLIQLKKGDDRISVGIRNGTDRILELGDCEAFSVRSTSPHSRLNVQLAHSLRTGISHEEALGFIQLYRPRKKTADDLIWYEIIRKDFEIRLAVDAATDTLISIEFKRFQSPWGQKQGQRPALPAEPVIP